MWPALFHIYTNFLTSQGKSLVIPTGQCCPQCLQPKSSCQVNETTHQVSNSEYESDFR